jgi:two-component system CheB/CheR fusion protein
MDDPRTAHAQIPVCGIGASAGGLEALHQFFRAIPTDLGLAYVVIVHLAPDRHSDLPAILRLWTTMPVIQVGDHDRVALQPDHIFVIAPDRQLELTDTFVAASEFDRPRGQRSAIDLFFRSLAETRGDAFAVLLSGGGGDGAIGARAVKERGGLVLVQDPGEAEHASMPRAAIATGVADVILPVRELAARLAELVRTKQPAVVTAGSEQPSDVIFPDEERAFERILDVLRERTGHDFAQYRRSTVLRRLSRRMHLAHQPTIAEYLKYLRASDDEPRALFNDLLISVTTFFRDPEAWAALQAQVIGPLVERTRPDVQLRAWVAGCATGEEAYSLAMLVHEEFTRRHRPAHFLIFASDVDESALAIARDGLYPNAIAADVSEPRLQQYFRSEGVDYRVRSNIRDHVVFACHSVLRDPPFSRLHLVTCRNLLIYLARELQAQVLATFQYACRDDGALFLGTSEAAGQDLFQPIDSKQRIFGMRALDAKARLPLPDAVTAAFSRGPSGRDAAPPVRSKASDRHVVALEQVSPPSVVVDEHWTVVHASPTASRFLCRRDAALSRRLTDLVKPELHDALRAVLEEAMETEAPQLSGFVAVPLAGAIHNVAVLAHQRSEPAQAARDILVTFLDAGVAGAPAALGIIAPEFDVLGGAHPGVPR